MIHKPVKIVSPKIRKSAKGESCKIRDPRFCNGDWSTVVLAHINSPFKGVGNKSPDLFAADACSGCHAALDAGKISFQDQLRAMQETLMRLYRQGYINLN